MITTIQEVLNGLKRLTDAEIEKVQHEVGEIILDRQYELEKNTVKTRSQIIQEFHHFGYIVPAGAKFWKVNSHGKGHGGYGMELGRYEHSCHIDDTNLIALLVVKGTEHFTESYADIWLSGPF